MKNILDAIMGGTRSPKPAKKFTAFAIIGTSIALVLAILILVISSIVFAVRDGNDSPAPSGDGGGNGGAGGNGGGSFGNTQLGLVATEFGAEQLYTGELIIVNDENPLSLDSANKDSLISINPERPKANNEYIYYMENINFVANENAVKAFNDMAVAFNAETGDTDLYIKNAATKGSSSTSVFQTGLVFELYHYTEAPATEPMPNDGNYKWIYENAYKYGFVQLYPNIGMKAHIFRYIGVAHATYMHNNASVATFEDYLALLKQKSGTSPLNLGNKVFAFYIAKDATAYVSSKFAYTVSGNNIDGYIVTVDTSKALTAS